MKFEVSKNSYQDLVFDVPCCTRILLNRILRYWTSGILTSQSISLMTRLSGAKVLLRDIGHSLFIFPKQKVFYKSLSFRRFSSLNYSSGSLPSPLDEAVVFDTVGGFYLPILYFNNYWNLASEYMQINDTVKVIFVVLLAMSLHSTFTFMLQGFDVLLLSGLKSSSYHWFAQFNLKTFKWDNFINNVI